MHKAYYGDRTLPCAECATKCAPREARADAARAEVEGREQRQEFARLTESTPTQSEAANHMNSKIRDSLLITVGVLMGGVIHSQFFSDRPVTDAKLAQIAKEACGVGTQSSGSANVK